MHSLDFYSKGYLKSTEYCVLTESVEILRHKIEQVFQQTPGISKGYLSKESSPCMR